LRLDVIAAAGRESGEIVGTARAEVRRIILQARHDLAVLRDQVRATIGSDAPADARPRMGDSPRGQDEPDDSIPGPNAVRRVLQEARSEIRALSSEAGAIREFPIDPRPPSAGDVASLSVAAASRPLRQRSSGGLWVLPVVTVAAFIGSCWWTAYSSDQRAAGPPVRETVATPSALSQRQNGQEARKVARVESASPPVEPRAITEPTPAVDGTTGELTASARRWLEAYYAQDRARMAAFSSADIRVTDQRSEQERLPRGLSNVERTLTSPRVQVFGSAAILTATVTERAVNPNLGQRTEAVSFMSQTWTHRDGAWQLDEVRLVSAAAVDRAFRR
jgi:hypothetical protein